MNKGGPCNGSEAFEPAGLFAWPCVCPTSVSHTFGHRAEARLASVGFLLLLVLEVRDDAAVGHGVYGQAQDGVVTGLGQNLGDMALHGAL